MNYSFNLIVIILAVLAGFVFIQVKAHLFWRLTSLALVLGFCSWVSYLLGGTTGSEMLKEYERGFHDVIGSVDQLAIEGRTNDVHEVCQKCESIYVLRMSDLTNLEQVVGDAKSRTLHLPSAMPKQ